jgi:hypothetical protein
MLKKLMLKLLCNEFFFKVKLYINDFITKDLLENCLNISLFLFNPIKVVMLLGST